VNIVLSGHHLYSWSKISRRFNAMLPGCCINVALDCNVQYVLRKLSVLFYYSGQVVDEAVGPSSLPVDTMRSV
jgi:hypothetical protein